MYIYIYLKEAKINSSNSPEPILVITTAYSVHLTGNDGVDRKEDRSGVLDPFKEMLTLSDVVRTDDVKLARIDNSRNDANERIIRFRVH